MPVPAGEGIAGVGLKGIDPERYGALDHPGDAFSYDIFHAGGPGHPPPPRAPACSATWSPRWCSPSGQSQSAFQLDLRQRRPAPGPLVRRVPAPQPHGRRRPLGEPGTGDRRGPDHQRDNDHHPGRPRRPGAPPPDRDRDPASSTTRRPASPIPTSSRLWEVAGTAHADTRVTGGNGEALGLPRPSTTARSTSSPRPPSATWWRGRRRARRPRRPNRSMSEPDGLVMRDADGNAAGGIPPRHPWTCRWRP